MRSITLSQPEIDALLTEVSERNLKKVPVTNEYELLRVKDKDIFFVLHNTKKMVFQESKGIDTILDAVLIEEVHDIIGTDEAGKGEWYGPLVVAGVFLTPDQTIELRKMGVSDSKSLSSFRIYEIGDYVKASGIEREVRVLAPETYNTLYNDFKKEKKNLNDILAWAHTGIIYDWLERLSPEKVKVVIDKFDVGEKATSNRLKKLKKFNVDVTEKLGGESEVAVAAASVLAKFIFEERIKELGSTFGIDLRSASPEDVPEDVLPSVAKLHFKNVQAVI